VTAPDRTPAPPLDESDLQAIEQRQERAAGGVFLLQEERDVIRTDVPALVAALRAAWRERDELGAALDQAEGDYESALAERDRYRAAEPLVAAACAAVDAEDERDLAVAITALGRLRTAREDYRAALAAPGAGGQATEERTT
jgi:hypothetical protein